MAAKVREGAVVYEDSSVSGPADEGGQMKQLEHEGDEVTHEIMRRLNTVFVTPFDHEDIHRLASGLDDVLDHIEAAADLLVLHRIEAPLPEMKAQADVLRADLRYARARRDASEVQGARMSTASASRARERGRPHLPAGRRRPVRR